jgi:hypothetical protein
MRKCKAADLAVLLRSVVNWTSRTMDSKMDMYGFGNVKAFLFGGHFKTAVTLQIPVHSVHYSKPMYRLFWPISAKLYRYLHHLMLDVLLLAYMLNIYQRHILQTHDPTKCHWYANRHVLTDNIQTVYFTFSSCLSPLSSSSATIQFDVRRTAFAASRITLLQSTSLNHVTCSLQKVPA